MPANIAELRPSVRDRCPGLTYLHSPEKGILNASVQLASAMEHFVPGVSLIKEPVTHYNPFFDRYTSEPRLDIHLKPEALDAWEAVTSSPEFAILDRATSASYENPNEYLFAKATWPPELKIRIRAYQLENFARNQQALAQIAKGMPRRTVAYSSFISFGRDDNEWKQALTGREAEFEKKAEQARKKSQELCDANKVSPITIDDTYFILYRLALSYLNQPGLST